MIRRPLIAAAAAAALLVPTGAGADASIVLSDLEVVPSASSILLKGDLDIADVATEVASDDTGDGMAPGTDLESGTITLLTEKFIEFGITLADPLPAVGGLPDVMHYHWDFVIDGTAYTLQAQSNSVGGSALDLDPGVGPRHTLQTCTTDPTTGQGSCTSAPVDGTFDESGITWTMPLTTIGAKFGSVITAGEDAINASAGASGLLWYTSGIGGDVMFPDTYTIPQLTVRTGVAASAADLTLDTTAELKGGGSRFEATIPTAAATGVAGAQACLGDLCTDVVTTAF